MRNSAWKASTASIALALVLVAVAGVATSTQAALTYSISGTWPGSSATNAANAMAAIVADYNAYGNFGTFNFDVAYVSGVPTAQSTYLGQIQVGGSYNDSLLRRVLEHETNHVLGSGTTNNWYNEFNSSGIWIGANMNALAAEFDGDGTIIKQSGVHFYPYGLNYDTEVTNIDSAIGAETVYMRNIAIMYAERQDDGLGPSANPWSATSITLKQSDALGTSAFNNWSVWSDNYFTHSGAAYSTGNFTLRTPLDTYNSTGPTPSFTFAGDSLTINNTNGINGGLLFKGVGTSGVLTFHNLILDGGYVRHASSSNALFQLAGHVTLNGTPTIDAAQGNINILADISGSGSLTKAGSFALTLLGSNTYSGTTNITAGSLVLNNVALPNTSGVNISGGATLTAKGSVSTGGTLTSSGIVNLADGALNTLNVSGGLSFTSATLNMDLGSSNADQIAASGAATLSGTSTINISPVLGQSMTNGNSYTLLSATGGLSAANFQIGVKPASLGFYQFGLSTPTSTALLVTVTGNPTPSVAYWTGQASATAGDSANNWGTGPSISKSNWSTNAAGTADPLQLPGSTTSVIFTAANAPTGSGTTSTQLDSAYAIQGLTFDVPSGLGITSTVVATNGNTLTVGSGGITLASTSNSSATFSGTGSLVVDGSQNWANNNSSRSLTVSAGISALSGPTTLTFNGSGAGGLTLGGVLSDGGGTLSTVFNQAGTTVLSGISSYSGTTTVSSGIVQISSTGRIASDTTIGSGATLMLNGGTDVIGDSNAVTIQSSGTLDVRATSAGTAKTETIGSLNGAGIVTRGNSGTTTLTVGSGSFSGTIQNGSGQFVLVKSGPGTLTLGGSSTYTGGTTINDGGGVLVVTSAAALGTGSLTIGNGDTNQTGELQLSSGIAITSIPTINLESRNVTNSDGSATIENLSGNNSISANLNINNTGGNSVNILSTTGKLTLTGNITSTGLSTSRGFNFYGSGDGLASGIISDGTAQTTFIQKDGTGTWTLSGANSYTSTTTLDAGNLVLSDTNTGAGTATTINGGTLVLGNANALGATANIQFPANSTGALDLALNSGSNISYTIGTNTTSNITLQSDVVTPGLGVTHSTGALTVGGGSITVQAGPNVSGGSPALSVGVLNMSAGSTQTTTFIPTTASLTLGAVNNTAAQVHTLALAGTASNNVITGAITSAQGTLNLTKSSTSSWILGGTNTYNGSTIVSGGILAINGSIASPVSVTSSGTLQGSGTINSSASVSSGAALTPGNFYSTTSTPGTLTINSSTTLSTGSALNINLGGKSSSQFSQLHVNGLLTVGGSTTLTVSLVNGFRPLVGDSFDIANWNSLSGAFSAPVSSYNGRVLWNSSLLNTSGVISVSATYYAGDFNRDGHVDAADIVAMEQALADPSDYEATHNNLTDAQLLLIGDVNGDTEFTGADLQALLTLLQSGGGQNSPVPEPSAFVLTALAFGMLWCRFRDCFRHEQRCLTPATVPSTR